MSLKFRAFVITLALFAVQTATANPQCENIFAVARVARVVEDIPNLVLATNRLVIRAVDMRSLEDSARVWTNPETVRMSGDAIDRGLVSQLLAMGSQNTNLAQASATRRPFINFGIYRDGQMVGMSQVAAGQESSIYASGRGTPQQKWVSMSYHLHPSAWGQGIASEAATRLVRFAFENLNVDGIHAEAITSNIGSIGVLRKAGFVPLDYQDPSYVHFYIDRAVFSRSNSGLVQAVGQ